MSSNQQSIERDLVMVKKAMSARQRRSLHRHCFGFFPRQHVLPSRVIDDQLTHPKLMRAILQLTESRAIIGRYQHHFTTWSNLESVFKARAFYGQETLHRLGIAFEPNSLAKSDINNGDGDVICFSPYLVDSMAFCTKSTVKPKKEAIRVTIDTDAIESEGQYHQFFKLADLLCPEFDDYVVHVNERLSFSISKWESSFSPKKFLDFKFIFDGVEYNANVLNGDDKKLKNDCFIYGSLYMINRFCLLKFTEFLGIIASRTNVPENALFVKRFLEYIDSLDDQEIQKILVLFGQTLTVFSELNFNSRLQLTKNLIVGIHDLNQSKTFNCSDLIDEDYEQCIDFKTKIITPLAPASIVEGPILGQGDEVLYRGPWKQEQCPSISLYGTQILHRQYSTIYRIPKQDFRDIPAKCFASGDYFESRPTLPTTNDFQPLCQPR